MASKKHLPKPNFPNLPHLHCAVSGGADSVALAILAAKTGVPTTLHHVDHGLREGSHLEAELVASLAERLGVSFQAHSVVVEGSNIEEKARKARYEVLPADVLTGHTLDDQAETFLLALGRGTGPAGLRGIDPTFRPLLNFRRKDTEKVCLESGETWFTDPSNSSTDFTRNRVRNELIPLMRDIFSRDPAPLITSLQEKLTADNNFLDQIAETIDVTKPGNFKVINDVILSRSIRAYLKTLPVKVDIDALRIEALARVLRGEQKGIDFNNLYFYMKNRALAYKSAPKEVSQADKFKDFS